jgi:hypothetical protein
MRLPASVEKFVVEGRQSRKMLLFIVYVALFLDNMLLTTVGTCGVVGAVLGCLRSPLWVQQTLFTALLWQH